MENVHILTQRVSGRGDFLPFSAEHSPTNEITETHNSLFDGSNEGIEHKELPVFSVQYHPEASPGPHDSHYLFNKFYKIISTNAKKN